jgi:hypothetical protein
VDQRKNQEGNENISCNKRKWTNILYDRAEAWEKKTL